MGYGNGMNSNKPMKKKPMKKNNSKQLSEKTMEKLREHSKLHPNGMRGRHMRNMVKFMKEGDSFSKAHSKAKALDKK